MIKTAEGLVAYVKKALADGWVYWYGTTGLKCTRDLLISKTRQYPEHYTSSREATYYRHISEGRYCADCINLVKGYVWLDEETGKQKYANGCPDTNANGMYKLAVISGNISTMPDVPGLILHKEGHAGVYIGNGDVIEARGFSYGVVKTKLKDRGWLHWYQMPGITYDEYTEDTDGVNPFTEPTKNIKIGAKGDTVRWIQWELVQHGYDVGKCGIDGDFGKDTKNAVLKFQTDTGIEVDGIVGKETRKTIKIV